MRQDLEGVELSYPSSIMATKGSRPRGVTISTQLEEGDGYMRMAGASRVSAGSRV